MSLAAEVPEVFVDLCWKSSSADHATGTWWLAETKKRRFKERSPAMAKATNDPDKPETERPAKGAVIYLRPFHADDVLIEHPSGLTIPQQGRACHKAADLAGVEVLDEIVDQTSTASSQRVGINRILNLVATVPVEFVIVYSQQRLFEQRDEFEEFVAALDMCGTRVLIAGGNVPLAIGVGRAA